VAHPRHRDGVTPQFKGRLPWSDTLGLMRLMIVLFVIVFLIIVDQAWFGGHYTSMLARMLRQWGV
jgi:hypothetical protein